MTAKTRLLASDLTSPELLETGKIPTICFPDSITALSTRELRLRNNVYVQLVDIEVLSKSRWEQVEELEAIERGEQTRGREVVRLPVINADGDDPVGTMGTTTLPETSGPGRNATHRLVLQDCKGQKVYGLELVRMPEFIIGSPSIGAKILLRKGAVVARGTILLDSNNCQILGGKIEAWQKAWLDGRLARLREAAGAGGEH